MNNPESYVLDANAFMEARKRFYPFDVCPGYWDALCWYQNSGQICSIDKVKDELDRGTDNLSDWAVTAFGQTGFHDTAIAASEYAQIIQWAQGQAQFEDSAKAEFASVADGWLIAYAMKTKRHLVTLEEFNPTIRRRIPIPNVCRVFDIEPITPFEMLRRLGVSMTWQPPVG